MLTAERLSLDKVVGALAVDDAAIRGISHAIRDGAHQVGLKLLVVHWGKHLDTVQQVSRHPVGRAKEVSWFSAIGKDEDAAVLQVSVDDAHTAYVLAQALDARYE